jgi:hypothetical protein
MNLNVMSVILSNDPNINSDLDTVVRSATNEFTTMFSKPPPAGVRPIYILYQSKDPLTDSTSDPTRYQIYLSVNLRKYAQLTFQLGHELCHIFADPRRTNWFVESCCEMASLVLLRRMSKLWCYDPPFPNWVSYAPNFEEYAQDYIRQAGQCQFGSNWPPNETQLRAWLTASEPSFKAEPCDRQRNVIIAEKLLRSLFEESADSWDALCFLGQAFTSPPASLTDLDKNSDFKFDIWLQAVPEHLKVLVKRIGKMFAQ